MSIIQTIRDTIVKELKTNGKWLQVSADEAEDASRYRKILDTEVTPEIWYGVASGQNEISNDDFKKYKDSDGVPIEFEYDYYDFDGVFFEGASIDSTDVDWLLGHGDGKDNRVFTTKVIEDYGTNNPITWYIWGVSSNTSGVVTTLGIMDILKTKSYAESINPAGIEGNAKELEIIENFLKEIGKLETSRPSNEFLNYWNDPTILNIKKSFLGAVRDLAKIIDGVQPGFYSFDTFVKKISIATSFILEYGGFSSLANLENELTLDESDMLLKNYTDGRNEQTLLSESVLGTKFSQGFVSFNGARVWDARKVAHANGGQEIRATSNTNSPSPWPQEKKLIKKLPSSPDPNDQKIIGFLIGFDNYKSIILQKGQYQINSDPLLILSNKVSGNAKNVLTYDISAPLFRGGFDRFNYNVEEKILEKYYQFAINLKTNKLTRVTDPVTNKSYFNLTKEMDKQAFEYSQNELSQIIVENKVNILKGLLFDNLEEFFDSNIDDDNLLKEIAKNLAKQTGSNANLGYEEDEISKKEIAERQKLLEQCALLLNLKGLATKYDQTNQSELAVNKKIHEFGYFGNRFLRVQSSNSSKTLTSLYSQKASAKPFLEITPVLQGLLVPKIKIQKILHRPGVIETIDVPFTGITTEREFDGGGSLQPINYQEAIKNRTIFRGGGVGIKSISFDFDGETPATAQKWVRSTMSLKFQDFGDLVAQRDTFMTVSTNPSTKQQTKFRFLDLIVNSTSDNLVEDGVDAFFREFYKPVDYKIKIDVGWNYQDTPATRNLITSQGVDPDEFFEAIDKQNKSFLFSALDHDINIADDGTIDLNINYFGYPDALLSSYKFNALVTQQQEKELKDELDNLRDLIKDGKCTKSQLAKLTAAIEQRRLEITKQSSRSIQGRLVKYGLLRSVTVTDQSQLRTFKQSGTFTHVPTIETSLDSGFSASAGQTKKFFFLGDLLYVLMDCLYEQNGTRVQGTENVSIILTDFEFNEHLPYSSGTPPSTKTVQVNLASIPISLDFFKEWFTEEILASERYNYPLMDFILILANRLMGDILTEVCYNKEHDKTLFFRQAQMFGSKEQNDQLKLFTNRGSNFSAKYGIVNLNHPYVTSGTIPLSYTGTGGAHDMYTFVAIYPDSKPLTHKGKGIYSDDLDQGIYHFHIGAASGLMKKVSFSKTNITYLRESRMMRYRGLGDFAQLSNVYNVSMELYGNFLFFPGMQIYVDPFGIGGDEFGNPSKKLIDNDVMNYAKLMGIGGYHLITSVKTTIGVEGFKTSIEARFFFSGDEDGNDDTLDGLITKQQEPNSLVNAGVGDGTNSADCGEIISVFETNTIEGNN